MCIYVEKKPIEKLKNIAQRQKKERNRFLNFLLLKYENDKNDKTRFFQTSKITHKKKVEG